MEQELVSVVMPAYNCERFIGESIESVLRQTYTAWELIIVDDGSTDKTAEIARTYAADEGRITVMELRDNAGPAGARNRAIAAAKGKYLAFLDSDDIWYEDKLKKQINFMQSSGAVFSYTNYEKITENGEKTGITVRSPSRVDYKTMLFMGDPIGNLTVVLDISVIGKTIVPDIRKRNDYALWLKVLRDKNCSTAYGLSEVLASYRLRSESVSHGGALFTKVKLLKYYWQLYRKIERLSVLKSFAAIISLIAIKLFNMAKEITMRNKFNRNSAVSLN